MFTITTDTTKTIITPDPLFGRFAIVETYEPDDSFFETGWVLVRKEIMQADTIAKQYHIAI